ncbi:MAG: hypothetical protein IT566_06080 [Rhodospirillaceae bacterium]|nr:hypothetical protein [Rhodospirillaceae bacterium]
MSLKVITLELARNPGAPHGDADHGYIFRAPLDARGNFDRFQWAAVKQLCTVRRIEKGREVESGVLVLNRHGQWVFSYAVGDEDDETLFRLAKHRFQPGDYVAITEHDGVERTFRVRSVADWHADPSAVAAAS